MSKKITYSQVADSIAQGDWHWLVEDHVDLDKHIQSIDDQKRIVVLLADIAKSLRVLRCSNFIDIPYRLARVRVAVEGLRRETKARARSHRRKL